ncbi:unnamed protein product [Paramecium primaurelia]|uniref:Uncharacterized protein n=1 Tax=Paramecium primaurelia TaxID=5886 RepID=A0A8S1MST1_PARPR|nr:unnamed protein product [Paramecium primaurelia]
MILQQIQDYPIFQSFLYVLGLLVLLKLLNVITFIWKLIRPNTNLQKYGIGSWILITGASDGIGKQLAIQFSQKGFKIILVARNRQKLEAVAKQLTTESHIIVSDFSQSTDKNIFDQIMDKVGERDVSVLVNNVGVDVLNKFHLLSDEEIYNTITVNCFPITMLCKRFIPRFLKRNQYKSAIVNVTSLAGKFPTPYFNVYSATKAFGEFLTTTINAEYPELEVFSLSPGEVSTNMTQNRPPSFLTISASDCANGLLKRMGSNTSGHWNHEIQAEFQKIVPSCFYNFVLIKILAPKWLKERSKNQNYKKFN